MLTMRVKYAKQSGVRREPTGHAAFAYAPFLRKAVSPSGCHRTPELLTPRRFYVRTVPQKSAVALRFPAHSKPFYSASIFSRINCCGFPRLEKRKQIKVYRKR